MLQIIFKHACLQNFVAYSRFFFFKYFLKCTCVPDKYHCLCWCDRFDKTFFCFSFVKATNMTVNIRIEIFTLWTLSLYSLDTLHVLLQSLSWQLFITVTTGQFSFPNVMHFHLVLVKKYANWHPFFPQALHPNLAILWTWSLCDLISLILNASFTHSLKDSKVSYSFGLNF